MQTKKHYLLLKGTLPNLNDYLQAERQVYGKGKFRTTKGNNLKKQAQKKIIAEIKAQKLKPIENKVVLNYKFYEPNKRRDKDNIASFAMKVVQDSLVVAGILKNDGWNYIEGFTCEFYVDKKNPRIEIELKEII